MTDRSPETRKRSNSSSSFINTTNNLTSDKITLRRGKWSVEEELYAEKIIAYFNKGLIPDVATGTTLRTYLSDKLQCDPMRITKKFAGASCIGKQVFQLNPYTTPQYSAILKDAENELNLLEQNFHARIGNKITSNIIPRPTVNNRKLNKVHDSSSSSTSNIDDSDDDDGDDEFDESLQYESVKLFRGPNDKYNNTTSIRRVISAPDISQYNDTAPQISFRSLDEMAKVDNTENVALVAAAAAATALVANGYSSLRRRDRSQSAMDLREFERLIADDQAAGNLLMDFYEKMQHNYKSIINNSEDKTDKSSSSTGSVMITTLKSGNDTLGSDSVVFQKAVGSNSSSPVGLAMIDMDALDLDINEEKVVDKAPQSKYPFGLTIA